MSNPTLLQLQAMKRTELQAFCKENELKANGKTDVLIALLSAHFSAPAEVAASPPAPAKKAPAGKAKKPSAKVNNKPSQVVDKLPAAAVAEVVEEEDEDEMRIGTPEAKKVGEKKTAGKVAKGKEVVQEQREKSVGPSSEARVYATSPGTKATIASLVSTVHSLQTDLTAARSALVDLESTVAQLPAPPAPQSPKLSKTEILAFVDAKIDAYRSELDGRVERLSEEIKGMEERSVGTKEGFVDEVLAVQDATKEWKDALEGVVTEFRQDVSTRLSALEQAPVAAVAQSPIRQPQPQLPASTLAAPSPSYSDAPPTQSMTAFSSPSPTRSLTRSPGARSLSLVPTSARKSPRKISNLALPSHLVHPRSPARGSPRPGPVVVPASPAFSGARALGKRTRDSDASDLSIEVLLSPPTRREEGEGLMAALFSAEKEVGHVRKRVRVNEDASSEQEDSFESTADQSGDISRSSIREDLVVSTKSGDEPSTSDPSFFASSSRLSLPSTSFPAPVAARKSLPMASLPFPIVSPFKRTAPLAAPFGELSNDRSPKKMKPPPTPPAKKTLYGTEEESRFEDFGGLEEEREVGSPVKSPGKQWARLGAWGGFGGK